MNKDQIDQYDSTAANNTDVGGVNIDEGCNFGNMNNMGREIMSHLADHFAEGSIASSSTTDLSTTASHFVNVTGTTTITAFGTMKAGTIRFLHFAGALTLTHNGTSLILPGAANISTAAGDIAGFVSEGSGNWRCLFYEPASGVPIGFGTSDSPQFSTLELGNASDTTLSRSAAGKLAVEGSLLLQAGKWGVPIPASAMIPATTSGPAAGQVEESNGHNYATLDFDASSDEYACFEIFAPASWNEGTVTFRVVWSTTATDTDGVAFALQAVGVADGDDSDVAYGTAVVVTDDAQSNAGDVLVTAESSAVTIAGSPAAGEMLQFRFFRDVSDANDDMTEDARVRQVVVYFTLDDVNDA